MTTTSIAAVPAFPNNHTPEYRTSYEAETDPNFWDCDCQCNFVHSKLETFCCVCGCCQHQQPDSRAHEVTRQILLPDGLPRVVTLHGMKLTYAGKGLYPYACTAQDRQPQAAIYLNHVEGAWTHEYSAEFVDYVKAWSVDRQHTTGKD